MAARNNIAQAHAIDKIVALTPLCFAIPLAVFGAEHLSSQQSLVALVPSYMPWRMFSVYFVGFALVAASLSIATQRQVQWSGLLFGAMMFLFVAMLHLPGAITAGGRTPWTIVVREMSFGGGGWVLAGIAMGGDRDGQGKGLITMGRVPIAIAAIFFGVQHFLHPIGLPGVPLEKQMPAWIPGRAFIIIGVVRHRQCKGDKLKFCLAFRLWKVNPFGEDGPKGFFFIHGFQSSKAARVARSVSPLKRSSDRPL